MPKNVQTTHNALISHVSKVMLKFSKLGFNSTWTEDFQMFKLDLEKAEATRFIHDVLHVSFM